MAVQLFLQLSDISEIGERCCIAVSAGIEGKRVVLEHL